MSGTKTPAGGGAPDRGGNAVEIRNLDGRHDTMSMQAASSRDGDQIVAEIRKNRRELIRISRSNFKGFDLVNIRVWAPGSHGGMVPTKAGIAIRLELLPSLLEAIAKAGRTGW